MHFYESYRQESKTKKKGKKTGKLTNIQLVIKLIMQSTPTFNLKREDWKIKHKKDKR